MTKPTEEDFARVLARLKAKEDAEHGPGAFDHSVARGRIMMDKHVNNLTAEERATLDSPRPAKRH